MARPVRFELVTFGFVARRFEFYNLLILNKLLILWILFFEQMLLILATFGDFPEFFTTDSRHRNDGELALL
jgi:hypothetical protein